MVKRVYLGEAASGEFVRPGAHPALVSAKLWQAANATLTTARQRTDQGYLLSGLCRCSGCGYVMQHSNTSSGYGYYRCSQRQEGSRGRCPVRVTVAAPAAEEAVARAFMELAWPTGDPDARPQPPRLVVVEDDLEQLRAAVEQATAELDATEALIIRREASGTKRASHDQLAEQAEARLAAAEVTLRQAELAHERDRPAG